MENHYLLFAMQETQNRNGAKHNVCNLVKALMTFLLKKLKLELLTGTEDKNNTFSHHLRKKKRTN